MVDFKETVLASVDVNANIAPAGDSIWARDGVVVPNTIFVSQVQIILFSILNTRVGKFIQIHHLLMML